MSRFSLSSSLALFQSVSGSDSDATNSSTSSNSAINNSSSSLSTSPSIAAVHSQISTSKAHNIAQSLFDQRLDDPFRFNSSRLQQQPNISNHLLELQREIKEEEEEIFALINDRSNLYTSFDDDAGIESHTGSLSDATRAITTNTSCQPSTATNDGAARIEQGYNLDYFHSDEEQGFNRDRDDLLRNGDQSEINHYSSNIEKCPESINNNTLSSLDRYGQDQDFVLCNRVTGQQPDPGELSDGQQRHYPSIGHDDEPEERLTDEQIRQEEEQQHHLDEYHRDIQQLTSNLPKPCVFFLEGNCRRSDCKYSHDLSSITCKYWIEGFCFKGELCPFLHSFNQKGQLSSLIDDEIALAKKKLNPTFTIESEADFPSLPLDAPNVTLSSNLNADVDPDSLSKNIENQILSSNPAVVFKTSKKKRKKG